METILHNPSTSTLSRDRDMPVSLPSSGKDANRKLRAHKKSRRGCGNCKLRKVKCDESKPRCKRCTAYGVFCNYDCKYSDLQLSVDGAFNAEIVQTLPYSPNQTIPILTAPSLRQQPMAPLEINASYQLREQDLELLSKFQTRTVLTITTDKNLRIYQSEIIKLAYSHPFLMHAVLTLTLMHDRYLSAAPNTKLSTTEVFHCYQGIALFNSKLSGPIQPSEGDALLAAAVLLGTIAFYYIEARTPEEAWPLKPPSSLDLNWLRMSDGKKEIWKIAHPSRSDSVFKTLGPEHMNSLPTSSTWPELEVLPREFIKLYGFDATPTTDNNPYHAAASALAQSLNIDYIQSIILNFLYFISNMRPEYKRLLEQKDPRALLLLAYWYAKVCQYRHWWIWPRAALECQAICIYLERYHRHEANIQTLLQFPRMMCGIVAG